MRVKVGFLAVFGFICFFLSGCATTHDTVGGFLSGAKKDFSDLKEQLMSENSSTISMGANSRSRTGGPQGIPVKDREVVLRAMLACEPKYISPRDAIGQHDRTFGYETCLQKQFAMALSKDGEYKKTLREACSFLEKSVMLDNCRESVLVSLVSRKAKGVSAQRDAMVGVPLR